MAQFKTILALLMVLVLVGPAAHAQEIFFNGVRIGAGALTDTTLDQVEEVQFDEEGNIHIIAPRYQVQVEGDPSARNPEAIARMLQSRFYMIVQNPNANRHRYSVRIRINDQEVVELAPGQTQHHLEVTQYLQLGANRVVAEFVRDGLPSDVEEDRLVVVIGRGTQSEGRLEIRRRELSLQVTGTEQQVRVTREESFTIQRTSAGRE